MGRFANYCMIFFFVRATLSAPPTTSKTPVEGFISGLKTMQESVMKSLPTIEDSSKLIMGVSDDLAKVFDETTKELKLKEMVESTLSDVSSRITQSFGTFKMMVDSADMPEKANALLLTIKEESTKTLAEIRRIQNEAQSGLSDAGQDLTNVLKKLYKLIEVAGNDLKSNVEAVLHKKD